MAGPSLTSAPQIPGGFKSAGETTNNVSYSYVIKQQAFTVVVTGLMPLTLHNVFFENQKVAANKIKPLNQAIGTSLYTDVNGRAEFVFYYESDIVASTTAERYNEMIQRVGGDKELVVINTPNSVTELSSTYTSQYTSFSKKNIMFKTTAISELPVKTNYSFAYPPERSVVATYADDGYMSNNRYVIINASHAYDVQLGDYVLRSMMEDDWPGGSDDG